jgi:uncharacterized protein YifN (PemK superfamily)
MPWRRAVARADPRAQAVHEESLRPRRLSFWAFYNSEWRTSPPYFVTGDDASKRDRNAMPLFHHPKVGDVLICDFPSCLREPEMVKKRPAIVVTREHSGLARLCTVVPLSTTAPVSPRPYHVRIAEDGLPRSLRSRHHWAKCDMLYTFCLDRFDRVRAGRDRKTGRPPAGAGRRRQVSRSWCEPRFGRALSFQGFSARAVALRAQARASHT